MSQFDTFLTDNARFQETFTGGSLPMPPSRKVAVLTCMDARLHPETFLGLSLGDAHVIRNAGGRASDDAIRSLAISEQLLGTQEIVVIHHTDCGMQTFTNDDLRAKLRAELEVDASDHDFLPFADLETSVREDVQRLRDSPLIPREIVISGAIYDVSDGKLTAVT